MPSPKITLAVLLLPFTLALAGPHPHESFHKHEKKPYQSGSVSDAPFASGTGGPFGLSNATASATGSGTAITQHSVITTTIKSTIYLTVAPSAAGSAVAGPGGAGSPISQAGSALAGSGAGNCPAPVTVTEKPTVTVTVTNNGGSPAGSGVVPAPVASSSSVAIPSISESPDSSEPEEPEEPEDSSAAPVASSPAVSIQAPQSSKAASVAPVASNAAPAPASTKVNPVAPIASGAPVQSVVASPVGLSPKPIESSPSVAASSAAAAPSGNTAAPASSGPTGSKRGLAFVANGTPGSEADQLTKYANAYAGKISWLGNFFCGPPPNLSPQIEYIPQMYGLKSVADWEKYGAQQYAKGVKHMFSFGEPETDNKDLYQDASTAVSNWMKYMQPYATNVTIGAPAVLQNEIDRQYLENFLLECKAQKPEKCKIGFVALHWVYTATPGNVQAMKNAVDAAVTTAKKFADDMPVWVDNFQAGGTSDEQIAFLKEIVPYLEKNANVQRYGYLPPALDNPQGYAHFLNADGSPSDLAKFYASME